MKKSFHIALLFAFALPSVLFAAASPLPMDPLDTHPLCTELTVNMQPGSRDSKTDGQVSDLQFFLSSKGYLKIDPTGYFGVTTNAAVKSFQQANRIYPNGAVGPITRGIIKEQSCPHVIVPLPVVAPTPTIPIGQSPVVTAYITGLSLPGNPSQWSTDATKGTNIQLHYSSANVDNTISFQIFNGTGLLNNSNLAVGTAYQQYANLSGNTSGSVFNIPLQNLAVGTYRVVVTGCKRSSCVSTKPISFYVIPVTSTPRPTPTPTPLPQVGL